MSDDITIPLSMPREEAQALAKIARRFTYEDAVAFSRRRLGSGRLFRNPESRTKHDIMWAAISILRRALATAGFTPR
jgi:hypothetical protein